MDDRAADGRMPDEVEALLAQFARSLTDRAEPWVHAHLLVGVFHHDQDAWLVVPRACLVGAVREMAIATHIPEGDQVDAVTAAEAFMPEDSTVGDAYLLWAQIPRDNHSAGRSGQVPDDARFEFTQVDGLLPQHFDDEEAILVMVAGRSPVTG